VQSIIYDVKVGLPTFDDNTIRSSEPVRSLPQPSIMHQLPNLDELDFSNPNVSNLLSHSAFKPQPVPQL
jgi:hypothetical protein